MTTTIRERVKSMLHAGAYTFHKDGSVTAKWSYFYRIRSLEDYIKLVGSKFPGAQIIDSGDHYHAFVGGAKTGSPKSSYQWVRFKPNL